MVIPLEILVIYDFFSRKLFEAQKFPGSNVTEIFRKFFFKTPEEFGSAKEFKEQARKHNRTLFKVC